MKEKLEKYIGIDISENVPLKNFTTFKVGGPAKFFVNVKNKMELFKTLSAVKEFNLPYFILGGGSNILVSDKGFDGVVINLTESENVFKQNTVTAFAGNKLMKLISESLANHLGGLDFAANIPGTVGGGVRGNCGAYGQGLGDRVQTVEAICLENGEVSLKMLTQAECNFEYRSSIFKQKPNWIVAEVVFKLDFLDEVQFQEIKEKISQEKLARLAKQPYDLPSAGCSFQNVIFSADYDKYKDWQNNGKLPAAKLIEEVGLKGKKIGGAMVSDKHANFIVNFDNATAEDIMQLISLVKTKVRDELGIQLMEEIEYVGF